MSYENDGGPAYPDPYRAVTGYQGDERGWADEAAGGMSLRDYFAGQAIVGLLMKYGTELLPEMAMCAYAAADAMLAAREKKEKRRG